MEILNELLVNFLLLTLNEGERNMKTSSETDIKKFKKHTLFALQLIHRWYLRVTVYTKFPTNL